MALVPKTFSEIITFTRASTATYVNAAGSVTSAAVDAPRFAYDPVTLAPLGFLIEEARTNDIRNNTMVGAVAGTPGTLPTNWVLTGNGLGTLTQTVVGTGTSQGITYIDIRFSGTTSTIGFNIAYEPSVGAPAASVGDVFTGTAYIAIVGGSITNITAIRAVMLTGRTSGGVGTTDNGTSGDNKATLTSNLQRFSATLTVADVATVGVQPAYGIFTPIGVAIDITIRIGLPQQEQGSFATSVIPTSTVAVTRAADFAVINTLSPWYRQDEGTLFAEFFSLSALTGAQSVADNKFPRLWQIEAGTLDSAVYWYGSQAELYVGNTYNNLGTVPTNTTNKLAVALSSIAGQSASSLNGETAQARSGVLSTASTAVNISNGGVGANNTVSNGYVRRIVYYPRRLTDTEIQVLTT